MIITFKTYQKKDFDMLAECLDHLHEYHVQIDPLRLFRRAKGYRKKYTTHLLTHVKQHQGRIIFAFSQGQVVGCIVGLIEKREKAEQLEYIPIKVGRVNELFVHEGYRSRGIGKKLMKEMEKYFKQKKCHVSRVQAFASNMSTYQFYQSIGYNDRDIELMKILT